MGLTFLTAASIFAAPATLLHAQSTQSPSVISLGSCSSSKLSDASGDVNLAFLVDGTGKASDIHVTSADQDSLKPCAKDIINSTQFHPATRDGRNVQFRMEMRVHVDAR